MIQKLKAKASGKKGFTLAELLVVVGILAVLVAIAIPVFTSSLKSSQIAVDNANYRSALAGAKMEQIYALNNLSNTGADVPNATTKKYFQEDGSWGSTTGKAVKAEVDATEDETLDGKAHTKGWVLVYKGSGVVEWAAS